MRARGHGWPKSALQSLDGLNGHQQHPLSERRGDEAVPLVEAHRIVINRMHDDGADTGNLRGGSTAPQRIGEQIGTKTDPLECGIDGEPGNEEKRNLVRHAATQLGCGKRRTFLHGRGDCVIADDPAWAVSIAHDISARRGAFAGERALGEPMIERAMPPIVERIDNMIGIQSLRWCNAKLGHGGERGGRSSIPERLTLHQFLELWRRDRRRIKHSHELLMALSIEKEGSLIEDRSLSFPPRTREHEFGQLLTAQRSGAAEHRLEPCSRSNLNNIILARRAAAVRTSVCHISKLLGSMWLFATTLSIHSRSQRHLLQVASLAMIAMLAGPQSASAQASPFGGASKQGYWWYEAPKPKSDKEPEPEALAKPVIPPMVELATWTPPKIRKLIEEQRDYAATVLTVDAVADFWRLQDFARRKARAFAGVTQIAMLQHPELNSKSANPMVGDARSEMSAEKDAIRRSYLRAHAGEFALVMFSRSTCGYCRVQWPIIQRFQEEMGWQVTLMDLDKRPDVSARFGVEITPTTMIIRRGSQQRMIIASGVEAYPNLAQMAYQAVRLLRGDIRPEQFMTGPGEDAGFFDALGNGPVSATDPRALGGDLVEASGGRP